MAPQVTNHFLKSQKILFLTLKILIFGFLWYFSSCQTHDGLTAL